MLLRSLAELERAIRDSWSERSCDPVDLPWSPANAAKGQCGVTALVVQDLLGGELLMAEVRHADGSRQRAAPLTGSRIAYSDVVAQM